MLQSLSAAIPEIWLLASAIILLMVGVFLKKHSFPIVYWLSFFVLVIGIIGQIIWFPDATVTLFNGMFISKPALTILKIVCWMAAAACLLMSPSYIRTMPNLSRFEFPILILFAVLGMSLMLSANHLITLYISIELQSLALYVLAAFNRDHLRSSEAGLKYFALGALSSGLLLYGCSLLYGFSGNAGFVQIQQYVQNTAAMPAGFVVALVFVVSGLLFKVSAVPFHMWTPDVYQGSPTPITAFFTTAPKLASLGLLLRISLEFFPQDQESWKQIFWLAAVGSMLIGAFAAIRQQNIKRLLAYSSIGHIGYAMIGLVMGGNGPISALLLYVMIYIGMSLGVFACLLTMYSAKNSFENLDDFAGLSKSNPVMAFVLALLLLSMAGLPPLAGFWGKFYIFIGAVQQQYYVLAIIGVVSSVVAAFYYLKIIKIMYVDEGKDVPVRKLPVAGATIAIIASLLMIGLFIFPNSLINLMDQTAANLILR